jgi:colanic acid/amylovoran biosynthesis glycosyltransferase
VRLGIDAAALPDRSPSPGVFRIVCAASGLGEKKGVRVLLEACRLLRARRVHFRCTIAGCDPHGRRLTELREQVRKQGLAAEVDLLGALAWPSLMALVARAGAFVHASIQTADGDMDGIPVSLIEASAMGVPVVASRLSGIPELVEDGRSGLLVTPGDVVALADAIELLARQPVRANAMGARARRRARERFSLERHVDALLDAWAAASGARVGGMR